MEEPTFGNVFSYYIFSKNGKRGIVIVHNSVKAFPRDLFMQQNCHTVGCIINSHMCRSYNVTDTCALVYTVVIDSILSGNEFIEITVASIKESKKRIFGSKQTNNM